MRWRKVPIKIGPCDTQATASNLRKGEQYEFRVKAVNEEGESEPLVSRRPITANPPVGMQTTVFFHYHWLWIMQILVKKSYFVISSF